MGSLANNQNNDLAYNAERERVSSNASYPIADKTISSQSAVSWAAVLAGTAVAAALSLILIVLGLGFGMTSISVWSGLGISAELLGVTTIAWLAINQIIAYGMGGYLAGRLRTKWVSVPSDEVYFRDTAHGFLTWAISSLLCATLLASFIGSIVGGTAKAGASFIGGAASAAVTSIASNMSNLGSNSSGVSSINDSASYMVSTLLRKNVTNTNTVNNDSRIDNSGEPVASINENGDFSQNLNQSNTVNTDIEKQALEILNIFMKNMSAQALPMDDVKYVGQLVSQQTGLTQSESEKRVAMTFTQLQQKRIAALNTAKDAAEKVRKVTANTALWAFVFLLIGAFSASLAATWGGKSRDN